MKKSKIFLLDASDFIKGLLMTVIVAILTAVYTAIDTNHTLPDTDGWKKIGMVSLLTAVSYLIKNLGTNSQDKFLKKEPEPTEPKKD